MLINRTLWESIETKNLIQYDISFLPTNFCYCGTYEPNVILFCDHNNKNVKAPIKDTGRYGIVYNWFKKELDDEVKKQGL